MQIFAAFPLPRKLLLSVLLFAQISMSLAVITSAVVLPIYFIYRLTFILAATGFMAAIGILHYEINRFGHEVIEYETPIDRLILFCSFGHIYVLLGFTAAAFSKAAPNDAIELAIFVLFWVGAGGAFLWLRHFTKNSEALAEQYVHITEVLDKRIEHAYHIEKVVDKILDTMVQTAAGVDGVDSVDKGIHVQYDEQGWSEDILCITGEHIGFTIHRPTGRCHCSHCDDYYTVEKLAKRLQIDLKPYRRKE